MVQTIEVSSMNVSNINNDFLVDSESPEPGDIPLLNRKIYKGYRVSINEHPYIVSIRRLHSHYVTGCILTKDVVISVAHPFVDVPVTDLGVVAGENYSDRGYSIVRVLLLVVHEKFDNYTLEADLALLKILKHFQFRSKVKPIMLFHPSETSNENKIGFVTGWGRCYATEKEVCLPRSSRFYHREILDPMLITVPIWTEIKNDNCITYIKNETVLYSLFECCCVFQNAFNSSIVNTNMSGLTLNKQRIVLDNINMKPGMICFGEHRYENEEAPCMAVPGAPLVVNSALLGLQSWGFACGYRTDKPVVYTNLMYYEKWLVHNLGLLRLVGKCDLKLISHAMHMYEIASIIKSTSVNKPPLDLLLYSDKEMEPLVFDKYVSELKGTVYDFRDALADGAYSEMKQRMLEYLRKQASLHNYSRHARVKTRPFLKKNLSEALYNDVDNDYISDDYE